MFSKQNELRSHLGCEEVQIIFRNWTIFVFKIPITFELSNKRFHKKRNEFPGKNFFLAIFKRIDIKNNKLLLLCTFIMSDTHVKNECFNPTMNLP